MDKIIQELEDICKKITNIVSVTDSEKEEGLINNAIDGVTSLKYFYITENDELPTEEIDQGREYYYAIGQNIQGA